jgi:hypothetical protein
MKNLKDSALLARRNGNRQLTDRRRIHRIVRLIEGVGTDAEKWLLLKYAVDHELMTEFNTFRVQKRST